MTATIPADGPFAQLQGRSRSTNAKSPGAHRDRRVRSRHVLDDLPTLLVDLHMLVVTGGRERTAEEFRGLLEQAGFTAVAVSESLPPFDYHVIEAAPA